MDYQTYLYVISKLKKEKKVSVNFDQDSVSFQSEDLDKWLVSTPVSSRNMSNFTTVGNYRFEKKGSYLTKSSPHNPAILFVKEFQMTNRYSLVRHSMKHYLEEAKKWKLAFQGIES